MLTLPRASMREDERQRFHGLQARDHRVDDALQALRELPAQQRLHFAHELLVLHVADEPLLGERREVVRRQHGLQILQLGPGHALQQRFEIDIHRALHVESQRAATDGIQARAKPRWPPAPYRPRPGSRCAAVVMSPSPGTPPTVE